ncbi:MAG: hypothetical protein ACERKD_12980 [Prolixibacteraceae bacterium]
MNQLPPIVLECPECGEKYLISRDSYTPSEKAILFSDGFFIDEISWRTPLIIGCVTCELGFFPQKGKIVAEPESWEDFNENWAHIKKAEPPTSGSLALELRARKNMDHTDELALRKEFWYSGNHSETGRLLMSKNVKFKKFWIESLEKLEDMLEDNDQKETLLKAEINRQLGNFERCIQLLTNRNEPTAIKIKQKAEAKNTALFSFC